MNAPVSMDPLGDPWTMPLEQIDVSDARIFQNDVWPGWFARLRRDDPVHFHAGRPVRAVLVGDQIQGHHEGGDQPRRFSPRRSGSRCWIRKPSTGWRCSSPWTRRNTTCSGWWWRRSSHPATSPTWKALIRERAIRILDNLPRNETFDWVEHVSIELTTQMLATLFDYPFERRRDLTYWSNVATRISRTPTRW
jgi:cytochrome P450